MKIMISQPMRGKTNEQIIEERAELVKQLEEQGHEVLDTIISENPPKDADEAVFYLAKSIEFLAQADALVCMSGWEEARGCRIEYTIANDYGKFIKCI